MLILTYEAGEILGVLLETRFGKKRYVYLIVILTHEAGEILGVLLETRFGKKCYISKVQNYDETVLPS